MDLLTLLPDSSDLPVPEIFPDPFRPSFHPLARKAASLLQNRLENETIPGHDFFAPEGGKMFGVLVVRDSSNRIGFLSAFSGMLGGKWTQPGFVPPVFDPAERDSFFPEGEKRIARLTEQIRELEHQENPALEKLIPLKENRAALSRNLQLRIFDGYRLRNGKGEHVSLQSLYSGSLPPSGAGDCAGPRLLHHANLHGFTPLAMAEFWWGEAPEREVRRHGVFYPACQGKCGPLLPFLLQGTPVEESSDYGVFHPEAEIPVVFEDEAILVVNKPAGILSVPGKSIEDSVQTRMQKKYPEKKHLLLVHRLDLATSGLLLIAKRLKDYKKLQKAFLEKTIHKRYVAILAEALPPEPKKGRIDLPLIVDLEDRPRQMVCFKTGKPATTLWEIESIQDNETRIRFYPLTGRTHQLRMHAAHKRGLGIPIKGDSLYGLPDRRLFLHAEWISFDHPVTGNRMELEAKAPF